MANNIEGPPVTVDIAEGVGWLTLNRPAAINAVNDPIRVGVPRALDALDHNPDVRVIVIRGAGERGFCVGADIKEFRDPESPSETRARVAEPGWIESLDRVRKPTIASIHGYCLGGGLELALACDVRVASACARFALPEIDLGLIPGGGGTQRLRRVIGLGRALHMLLTADRIDAAEALRIGLVTSVHTDRQDLAAQTRALALKIAAKPATAAAYVKEAALSGADLDLASGLRLEKDLFAVLMCSEERVAAAAAFRARKTAGGA
jgi:enoyl-CoA hydratase